MGSFVPRLLVLTVVWLLATAALTFAAARRMGTVQTTTTTTTAAAAPSAPGTLVVPDVRRQAYVFAKGTLGDSGFAWKVEGAVQGFASNLVAAQTPAPGTRVVDTGAPTILLHLTRAGKQSGVPEESSDTKGTALRLAGLASAAAPRAKAAPAKATAPAAKQPKVAPAKAAAPAKKAVAPAKAKAPAPAKTPTRKKTPASRPPAFVVAGARREPLDEMPLTNRARLLLTWINTSPKPTDANVERWLYQHAWIVQGAEMGWWHGADALHTLVTVDGRVWDLWGIGARSSAVAQQALAEVEARSS
jgi:hypothetical protein